MNIIKEAILIANQRRKKQINLKCYNNIHACIKTLSEKLCNLRFINIDTRV